MAAGCNASAGCCSTRAWLFSATNVISRLVNGIRFDWCGVDKLRIRGGKIVEERVYSDTAPLRATQRDAGADHQVLTAGMIDDPLRRS
jgi:hypothetical protein